MSHNVTYRAQGNPFDVSVAMAVLAPTTLAVKGFRLGVVTDDDVRIPALHWWGNRWLCDKITGAQKGVRKSPLSVKLHQANCPAA